MKVFMVEFVGLNDPSNDQRSTQEYRSNLSANCVHFCGKYKNSYDRNFNMS